MKLILTIIAISLSFHLQAVTYTFTWNGSAGSTAVGVMTIDETVCLQAGNCAIFAPPAVLGISSYNLTIAGGCAAGTYTLADITNIILDTNPTPDLTTDLLPQSNDLNIFSSNGNISGTFPFNFGGCEQFTMASAIPSPTTSIPTLSQWGMIIFTLLLLNMSVLMILKRNKSVEVV